MRVTFLEPRNNLELYLPKLKTFIEALVVNYGADAFYFGECTRFSLEVQHIVQRLKDTYPYIDMTYVVADRPDAPPENERRPYPKFVYLSALAVFGGRDASLVRDVWLIDNCDIVVLYPTMDQRADISFRNYVFEKAKTVVMAEY
ncbi:MAG: hypothetical protein IJF74_04880 [Clostridia bacterium]|nr:hypothetical protein [Clostridia bacterium]